MRRIASIATAGAAALLSLSGATAWAEGGNARLCAVTEVLDCSPVTGCERVSPTDAGLPEFLRVDANGQGLRSAAAGDERRSSARAREVTQTGVILVGIENLRGWSAVLSEGGRRLVGTTADHDGAFVVFGVCTGE